MKKRRIRESGIKIGRMRPGSLNKITDVPGVKVGHSTLNEGSIKTGVTAILPHGGNIFTDKVVGASCVMNGFGKTLGTIQINELGTIETPILLTNTLSIGQCADSLLKYMAEQNPQIGTTTGTVNPVVCECNDMVINNIRAFAIREEHVNEALSTASSDFLEGSVGAGTGMKCFGLKGGIGSASRILSFPDGNYTLGVLVLSNFGVLQNLQINGIPVGEKIRARLHPAEDDRDRGSIIVIVATDLPVSSRQLRRIIRRATIGLARTGSFMGNGSGDIFIGFSTATLIPYQSDHSLLSVHEIYEDDIEQAFNAAAEATEEAILNSLLMSPAVVAQNGRIIHSLSEFMDDIV
jgi:D-aminopeptidase